MEAGNRKPTIWDTNPGYNSVRISELVRSPDDATWRSSRRGAAPRMVWPYLLVGLAATVVAWVVGGVHPAMGVASVVGFVIAVLLGIAAYEFRYVGSRSVIFGDTWLAVTQRKSARVISYAKIESVTAWPGRRFPELEIGPGSSYDTGSLVVKRRDGLPVTLPRLYTWRVADRDSLQAFVEQQAVKRGLSQQP